MSGDDVTYPPDGQHPQQPYNGQAQPQQYGHPPQAYGHPQPAPYPPQQMPVPYGQPQPPYATGGYPVQQPMPQQPMHVQQVGHSVTKPAWTCGEMVLMFCSMGLAYPIIWMRRRSKTTITRHH